MRKLTSFQMDDAVVNHPSYIKHLGQHGQKKRVLNELMLKYLDEKAAEDAKPQM